MRKASTALLEQGTQAPSPAPDLIPAENERRNLTRNSYSDWYSKWGHFTALRQRLWRWWMTLSLERRSQKLEPTY
jgi:hypothetical protein